MCCSEMCYANIVCLSLLIIYLLGGMNTLYQYGTNNPYTLSEFNTTCVDLVDVFPVPNSVLRPVSEGAKFTDYAFHFWYSHPLKIRTVPVAYLSVSFTQNIFPFYATYYGESESSILAYFRIPNNFKIARRVVLVIEGAIGAGKGFYTDEWTDWKRLFQSLRSYEVQQHVNWTYVSIQTVIIGQYYFGKSTQSRLVELPEPVTFFRSYCKLHKKRKLFPQQISALNYTENIVDRVIVHSYGHQLEISETSNSLIDSEVFGRVQMHISIPLYKTVKKYTIEVPRVVIGLYKKLKLSVELPTWTLDFTIGGRHYALIKVPVVISIVNSLRERIYQSHYNYQYSEHGTIKKKSNKFSGSNCSSISNRSIGRPSLFLTNVFETELELYTLIPLHHRASVEVLRTSNSDVRIKLPNKKDIFFGYGLESKSLAINKRAALVNKALSEYYCLIPISYYVPLAQDSTVIISADECIFVPKTTWESNQCGGLQIYRNQTYLSHHKQFCSKEFGDCIGAKISSTKRFPLMSSFGQQELTGMIHCDDWVCMDILGRKYKKFSTDIYSEVPEKPYVPKSSIHFVKQIDGNVQVFLEFLLPLKSDELRLGIDQVKILKPNLVHKCAHWNISIHSSTLVKSSSLMMAVKNNGKGGVECIFTLRCSNLVQVHLSPPITNLWIGPEENVNLKYSITTLPKRISKDKFHKCIISMAVAHPLVHHNVSCSHHFKATTRYNSTCALEAPFPVLDLYYYALPLQVLEGISVYKKFNRVLTEMKFFFINAITVVMDISYSQLRLLELAQRIIMKCSDNHIIILKEDDFLDAIYGRNFPSNVTLRIDFTKTRKFFFYSSRPLKYYTPSLCFLEVVAVQPNRKCILYEIVVSRLLIPLTTYKHSISLQEIFEIIYGKHTGIVLIFLGILILCVFIFWTVIFISIGYKICIRKNLPAPVHLENFKKDLKKEKKKDKEYWGNPQVYIKCGEVAIGPHFILHNFKVKDSFSFNLKPKKLAVLGELRYENKKLPIQFGHVKNIFVKKGPLSDAIVLLQASSGIFLLEYCNVSPEYKVIFKQFIHHIMKRTKR